MTHPVRRTTTGWLVAAVLALVAGTVGLARPAGAADGRCDGVWVVVDARALGGQLTTRCAEGDPSSGLEALQLAGHTYGFVPRQPGMVCTIDARPDPCNGAPTDAYWGYFHAEAGGEWTYSTRGAGNRDPEPGSVEGWAFGDDAEPGRRPPSGTAAPAPSPTPTATATPATRPSPEATPSAREDVPSPERDGGSSVPETSSSAAPPASDADASEDPTAAPSPTDATTTGDGVESPAPTDAPPAADTAEPAHEATTDTTAEALAGAQTDDETGSSATAPTVAALLVIGIASATVVRSRRRDDGQG